MRDHSPFTNLEDGDELITYYSIHNSGISNDTKRSKEIALTNAIKLRKEDVVFVLLRGGVDANCRDEVDVPALYVAIETGSLPVLKMLVDKDIDLVFTTPKRNGESSLHLAARLGMPNVVESLLYWGANILDVDEQGSTALFSALEACDLQAGCESVRILLGKVPDVNRKDHQSKYLACSRSKGQL